MMATLSYASKKEPTKRVELQNLSDLEDLLMEVGVCIISEDKGELTIMVYDTYVE